MKRTANEVKKFRAIYNNVQKKHPDWTHRAIFMRTKTICNRTAAVVAA